MRYMLLIYENDADRVKHMRDWMPTCASYVEAMKKAGIYVGGERLRGVDTTTSVRVTASGTDSAAATSPVRAATLARSLP